MSSGVIAKAKGGMPQLPLLPVQPLPLTTCSVASLLAGSSPHRSCSPVMDEDASGSSNFGAENDVNSGQQPQQSFCLKWNNYQSNVTTTFKELLADEDFVDITLTADGGALKAHKVVLSACSPYFRDILRGISAWQHPVIVLKDVPYSDLQGIVEFIYHGEVSVFQESLTSFLRTAQILRVKGLTEDPGNEKPQTKPPNSNATIPKPSSNKRSHHHVRKNATPRPTRARVVTKRPAPTSSALLGGIADVDNNNSEEEVVELLQPQSVATSPFSHLPPPAKRSSLLGVRGNVIAGRSEDADLEDGIEDEEEEAEIDDVEDLEGEECGNLGNADGSDDEEEEEEMANPPLVSTPGGILNIAAVADALANNPAEAAKILEQHQQLDKRQRQQYLMQGGDILPGAGLDPDFLPVGIPPFSSKLGNNVIGNPTSSDGINKASTSNGTASAATIAAMANAIMAAAAANHGAAGNVAAQQQNQAAAAAAALVSAANSCASGAGSVNNLSVEIPDPNDPNASSQKKTCPYCFQQLSWHALSRHIRDMHRAKTGLVTCKYCHKMFRNKNSLGCHMWRFHKDMREKDQGGSSSSVSGIKSDNGAEGSNQTAKNGALEPYSFSELKSEPTLSVRPTSVDSSKDDSEGVAETTADAITYNNSPPELTVAKPTTKDKDKLPA